MSQFTLAPTALAQVLASLAQLETAQAMTVTAIGDLGAILRRIGEQPTPPTKVTKAEAKAAKKARKAARKAAQATEQATTEQVEQVEVMPEATSEGAARLRADAALADWLRSKGIVPMGMALKAAEVGERNVTRLRELNAVDGFVAPAPVAPVAPVKNPARVAAATRRARVNGRFAANHAAPEPVVETVEPIVGPIVETVVESTPEQVRAAKLAALLDSGLFTGAEVDDVLVLIGATV